MKTSKLIVVKTISRDGEIVYVINQKYWNNFDTFRQIINYYIGYKENISFVMYKRVVINERIIELNNLNFNDDLSVTDLLNLCYWISAFYRDLIKKDFNDSEVISLS